MQMVNNYDKDVFNGDIGRVTGIDEVEQGVLSARVHEMICSRGYLSWWLASRS
jgi:ATP-dependent exoDNAse (exonuclease V) alpha subunit